MNGIKYDEAKRSKAGKAALLRAVVAAYIAYLAFKIVTAKDSSMNLTTARIIGAAFIVADIAFAVYTYMRFQSELKAAEITDNMDSADKASENEKEEE
ncbi:hypothetical protein [Ruminococcus sp.]|uniref:hypothetical protein n=1 Tax=Ruminococcus sp. TaxID=41978 RepID=UPI001B6B8B74|nr:hypothetical protein [Ruminococcus sp.]MBP5433467.1 hypothetical protein [Ruminococcus sp.]